MIAIYENNLMWSGRWLSAARTLGVRAAVLPAYDDPPGHCVLALIHLDLPGLVESDLVSRLAARGIRTVGHAGHKETELLARGRELGIDEVVTNSTLVHHIGRYLAPV